MKLENEFKKWLKKCRYSAKTVGNKISNCRNVEKSYDDLDAHYEKDECKTIISELTYSADDARENRQSKHSILIKGNQRTGSATLKAAVRLYVAFRNDLKNGFSLENRQKISSNPNTKKEEKQKSTPKSLPHYEFPDNSKEVEETIAIALGKVCHFIQPQIVAKIREANIEFKEEFKAFCGNLDIDTFLFEDSDCVFPGVRRPINKEKKKDKWKNNINPEDNTILNDNTIPRHIWAFLSMNKKYSGGKKGMWSRSGLSQFELAHIFGHKEDEKELEREVFSQYDTTKLPYALFTSASNTVLIPNGLMKPTDKCKSIKIAFYKRYIDLYGNHLYAEKGFDETRVPEWYSKIEWIEPPKLPEDWEKRIDNLLKYRKEYLIKKYLSK